MALWGNKDSKPASGTIGIFTEGPWPVGFMQGSGTAFTTQAKVGNTVYAAGNQYVITQIMNDTEAFVQSSKHGADIINVNAGTSYALSEKPAYVALSESADTFGDSGDSSRVFGVDKWEVYTGAGIISDIAIVQGGANYTETPHVTIDAGDGGQAAATATISGGVVTAITVTDNGGWSYQDIPNVYIDVPRRSIGTGLVNTTANTLDYDDPHGLENGDAVIYRANGGTAIAGLTDGGTYYVNTVNNSVFKLYDTKAHSQAGGATGLIDLTGTGNNAQYFDLVDPAGTTATAKAVKGVGHDDGFGYAAWAHGEQHVTHSGWVRKTVGTGGRAGRVFYETLVAGGAIQGDANDDIQFPDD